MSFYSDSTEWKNILPRQIQQPADSWLAQANNFHSRAISKIIKNYFKKATEVQKLEKKLNLYLDITSFCSPASVLFLLDEQP